MPYYYFNFLTSKHNLRTIETKLSQREFNIQDNKTLLLKKKALEEQIAQNATQHPLEHHFFSSIPEELVYEDFSNHLDLKMIQKIGSKTFAQITQNDLPGNKIQALIILMTRWPNQSPSEYCAKLALDINNQDYFYVCAALNRVTDLKTLNVTPEMIAAHQYKAFRMACHCGHIDTMNWLFDAAQGKQKELIDSLPNVALQHAYDNADFNTMQWLMEHMETKQKSSMIGYAFESAYLQGDLKTMRWLAENLSAQEDRIALIVKQSNRSFLNACAQGRLDILEWLLLQVNENQQAKTEMLTGQNNQAYINAVTEETRNFLKAQVNAEQRTAMETEPHSREFINNYAPGRLSHLKQIYAKANAEQRTAMLEAHDYQVFRQAYIDCDLETIDWLLTNANKDQKSAMIEPNGYGAFQKAATRGRLDIMMCLDKHATPDQRKAMVAEDEYNALQMAYSFEHREVMNWLLQKGECFSFAQGQGEKYEQTMVNPFMQKTVLELRQEYQNHPNKAVFDVNAERALLCYYLLKQIIELNERSLDEDMKFLLKIPSVHALASNPEGELQKAAVIKANNEAINLLQIDNTLQQKILKEHNLQNNPQALYRHNKMIKKEIREWAINELNSRLDTLEDKDIRSIYDLLHKKRDNNKKFFLCLDVIGVSEEGKLKFQQLAKQYGDQFTIYVEQHPLIEKILSDANAKNDGSVAMVSSYQVNAGNYETLGNPNAVAADSRDSYQVLAGNYGVRGDPYAANPVTQAVANQDNIPEQKHFISSQIRKGLREEELRFAPKINFFISAPTLRKEEEENNMQPKKT